MNDGKKWLPQHVRVQCPRGLGNGVVPVRFACPARILRAACASLDDPLMEPGTFERSCGHFTDVAAASAAPRVPGNLPPPIWRINWFAAFGPRRWRKAARYACAGVEWKCARDPGRLEYRTSGQSVRRTSHRLDLLYWVVEFRTAPPPSGRNTDIADEGTAPKNVGLTRSARRTVLRLLSSMATVCERDCSA